MFQKILFSNFTGQNKYGQSSSLSELLDNPETTLLRLLDEETFVSQFKSGAQRVKDFMNYQRFVELTELVTVVGSESDKKRGYKFPLLACELLVSDNTKIQEYFLPATGIVTIEEKVTKTAERMVEQQIDDDDEDEQNDENSKSSQKKQETTEQSSQKAGESVQKKEDDTIEEEKKQEQKKEIKQQQKKEQDEFGDFVQAPAKKKKTVMIKEVVQTVQIQKKQFPPLLNKLLNYFAEPINHTLTGYVCKILIAFTNKKNNVLFPKLFQAAAAAQSDNLFNHVFSHIGSRSTVEWLTRIFTLQNKNYLEQRFQLLIKLVKHLSSTQEVQNLSNIAACACQTYEKIGVYLKTPNPIRQLEIFNNRVVQLMNIVVSVILTEKQPAATYATQIFAFLISTFPISEQSEKLSALLIPFIQGAIGYLKRLLLEEFQRVGLMGLKLMQILNSLLRCWSVNQWFAGKANENIFPILLALVRKYSCNNIFHNQIFKFIRTCLTSPVEELIQFVVNKGSILEWLEEESKSMEAHLETKSTKPRNGYAEHIVFLCKYLKESATANSRISELVSKERFTYAWKTLVDRQVASCQKLLGGLAKKQSVHKIMYTKESILAAYATFLASAPIVVQEKDLNDPLQNELLLEQLKRQLDGIEDIAEPRSDEVKQEEFHKAELIEENDHHKNAFWKMHLDFNVDHLLEELM